MLARRCLALPVLLVAALSAACGSSDAPPQVTFTAGSASVVAKPTQYCDVEMKGCTNDETAPVTLSVPPGTELHVTVPEAVSSTPWQVAFRYRDASGAQQEARTAVFPPGKSTDATVALDGPTSRLLDAQVQEYGGTPQPNEQGGVDFQIRATWVLTNQS